MKLYAGKEYALPATHFAKTHIKHGRDTTFSVGNLEICDNIRKVVIFENPPLRLGTPKATEIADARALVTKRAFTFSRT